MREDGFDVCRIFRQDGDVIFSAWAEADRCRLDGMIFRNLTVQFDPDLAEFRDTDMLAVGRDAYGGNESSHTY